MEAGSAMRIFIKVEGGVIQHVAVDNSWTHRGQSIRVYLRDIDNVPFGDPDETVEYPFTEVSITEFNKLLKGTS